MGVCLHSVTLNDILKAPGWYRVWERDIANLGQEDLPTADEVIRDDTADFDPRGEDQGVWRVYDDDDGEEGNEGTDSSGNAPETLL